MGVTTLDKFRLGLMWGMSLTEQDLDKYALYFFLSNTRYGCNFLDAYNWFFLVAGICMLVYQPICGLITDWNQERTHLTMIVASFIQFLCLLLMLIGVDNNNIELLCAIWLVRQFATTQNQNTCWKLIKLRLDALDKGTSTLEDENLLIGRIGNIGDISSDIFEGLLLGSTFLLPFIWKGYTEEIMKWSMIGGTLLSSFLELIICLSFTKSQITPSIQSTQSLPSFPINTNDEEVASLLSSKPSSKNHSGGFIWTRFLYVYKNKVAMYTLIHCFVVFLFYNLVEYPLTLRESKLIAHQGSNLYCDGLLFDLMNQGFFLNITFFLFSSLYGIFLVPCRPIIFFRYVYSGLGIILFGVTLVLWFTLPPVPTFIIVSVAQVMPYYLSMYDFYVITSSTEDKYYGFVNSLYGWGIQVIGLIPAAFLFLSSLSNDVMILICLAILVTTIIYAVVFSVTHKADLKKTMIKEPI